MCRIPIRVKRLIEKGHPPYCQCCEAKDKLTFDHIYPKSKGGPDCDSNGQILCERCNNTKSNLILSIPELREILFVRREANAIPWYEPYRLTA
ncbi:MAG: HNH endonuclease signature motif containing protein [Cryomorphaceae bacterium]